MASRRPRRSGARSSGMSRDEISEELALLSDRDSMSDLGESDGAWERDDVESSCYSDTDTDSDSDSDHTDSIARIVIPERGEERGEEGGEEDDSEWFETSAALFPPMDNVVQAASTSAVQPPPVDMYEIPITGAVQPAQSDMYQTHSPSQPWLPGSPGMYQTAKTDLEFQPVPVVDMFQTAKTELQFPPVDFYETAYNLPMPSQQITPVKFVANYVSPPDSIIADLDRDLVNLGSSTRIVVDSPEVIPPTPEALPVRDPLLGPISRAQTSTARSLFQREETVSPDLFEDDIVPITQSPTRPLDFSGIQVPHTPPMVLGRKRKTAPVGGWRNQYSDDASQQVASDDASQQVASDDQQVASSSGISKRGRPSKRRGAGRAQSVGGK